MRQFSAAAKGGTLGGWETGAGTRWMERAGCVAPAVKRLISG